jgi:hypothetical protein
VHECIAEICIQNPLSKPTYLFIAEVQRKSIHLEMKLMGKGMALLGLILIIFGLLPVILGLAGLSVPVITDLFTMLNLYSIELAGYVFTEIMLILIVLGVLLLIIGAAR